MIISPQTSEIPSGAHDLTSSAADLRLTPAVSDGATPFPSTSETQVGCTTVTGYHSNYKRNSEPIDFLLKYHDKKLLMTFVYKYGIF